MKKSPRENGQFPNASSSSTLAETFASQIGSAAQNTYVGTPVLPNAMYPRSAQQVLRRYHAALQAHGVKGYTWDDLVTDYQNGLIFWLVMPVQDGADGSWKDYWWPKMQCLVAAFRDWRCEALLEIA